MYIHCWACDSITPRLNTLKTSTCTVLILESILDITGILALYKKSDILGSLLNYELFLHPFIGINLLDLYTSNANL